MKYYTFLLSGICVLAFILQIAIPGFTNALILNPQSWSEPYQFVTSIFLHGSPEHLIFNLFALLLFGFILEKIVGSNKFILTFFISGIIANLIAVNFYSASLGASGAIYGILGCLTILRPKMTVWAYALPLPMFLAAIVWVLVGIFGIFMPGNTGHIAHLSGIAVGAIMGLFIRLRQPRTQPQSRWNIPDHYLNQWEDVYMGK